MALGGSTEFLALGRPSPALPVPLCNAPASSLHLVSGRLSRGVAEGTVE
jgi:hypothetical protein